MRPCRRRASVLVGLSIMALASTACTTKTLVFGTATKFALDISARADQSIEVTMGYDRYELVSIPAVERDAVDGDRSTDTYSVLGLFGISYGNPFATQPQPLVLRQFFATGWAARRAVESNSGLHEYLGSRTGRIIMQGDRDIPRLPMGVR